MPQQTLLEAVAEAIEAAQKVRPYGLYNYTGMDPGDEPPHVIRDELAREGETSVIARYTDRDAAQEQFDKLNREYVARVALAAVNKWMADDFLERQQRMGLK